MREVTIDGVEYLPAATLAKQFRYTTDYIGQLCRAKKVDAKLVGRTWYVNPLSLNKHKKARYKKSAPAEKTAELANEITLSRIVVDPKVFVPKQQKPVVQEQPHFARRIDWKPLKYEADEVELLPQVKRNKDIPQKIKLNLAESTPLSVKDGSKETKMVADELPTVSLKGKLTVESFNDDYSYIDSNSATEMVFPEIEDKPKNIPNLKKETEATVVKPPQRRFQTSANKVSLIPTDLARKEAEREAVVQAAVQSGRTVELLLLTTTTTLTACVLLLLFGELNIVARPGFYEWEFALSSESLPALVSLFSR